MQPTNPRILGIDISDLSTDIVYYPDDKSLKFPTVICKNKSTDEWFVGEDAYANALNGNGIITDKLLSLALKNGTSTIGGIKYSGFELLTFFFKTIIGICMSKYDYGFPDKIVISVEKVDNEIIGLISSCFTELGYLKNDIHIISRAESFIYYVSNHPKEVWNNQVGLFYLSDLSLTYFEMKVQRNSRDMVIYAESENLEEAFNIDILSSTSGSKLADKILTSCAERLLQKKVFSSIMLTGKGFTNRDWAENFMKFIGNRRRVFLDFDLFAKGACYRGVDLCGEKPVFNFISICDGRLDTTISINIEKNNKDMEFVLAKAGDYWHTVKNEMTMIPDGVSDLVLNIIPIDRKKRRNLKIPFDFMPDRPKKTWRVDFKSMFKNESTFLIEMKDAGFGEIFKATNSGVVKEVNIWD